MFKKILILFFIILPLNSIALEKKTTFNKELFNKAQSDGKVVVVSSWIKYCYSCASQMKVLDKAKKEAADFEARYKGKLASLSPSECAFAHNELETLMMPLYKVSQYVHLVYATKTDDDAVGVGIRRS